MVLGEPLASLITFFRKRLIKLHLNSQQMSDFFYHMTESCELNLKKKKVKKTKKKSFGHVLEFLGMMTSWCKHTFSAICDVMKSYLTRV